MFLWPLRLVWRSASLVVAGVIVYVIVCGVQVVTASRDASSTSSVGRGSTIVVAGCPDQTLSADQASRLAWAARLYGASRAPGVTVCAASVSSELAERSFLGKRGVGASAVSFVRRDGVSGELSSVAGRVGRQSPVVVVTDAIDVLWTQGVAGAYGLRAEMSSPPASKKLVFSEIAPLWREATGVAVGRIVGFHRAFWAG